MQETAKPISTSRNVGKMRSARAQSFLVALLTYVVFKLDVTAVNLWYQNMRKNWDGSRWHHGPPKISENLR